MDNSLTERLTKAIDTLEAQIAADLFDIQRGRAAGDPEKIAIHAGEMAANAIRLEVLNEVATWLVEAAEPAAMPARNSGALAMAAAMTTMM